MARQNKLKKTGGLKTNGGLMNKIFKVLYAVNVHFLYGPSDCFWNSFFERL